VSRRSAITRLVLLVLAFVVCAGAFALSGLSASGIRDRVHETGAWAPIVFIPLSAILTCLFVPGPLLAGSSGLLFGVALGTPISIASATLGAILAFAFARWWGHDSVEHLAGERLNAARVWIGDRGFRSVFYARLAPGAPYSLVNYAAGLTTIALADFSLATLIGCAPRAFAYTALGGSLGNLDSPEAIVAMAVIVVMAIVGVIPIARERRARRDGQSAPGTDS
jgi:uncharacterized membrane protein YdjX (TVP38/TMEM64 family)